MTTPTNEPEPDDNRFALVPAAVAAIHKAATLTDQTPHHVANKAVQLYAWILQQQQDGYQLAMVKDDITYPVEMT